MPEWVGVPPMTRPGAVSGAMANRTGPDVSYWRTLERGSPTTELGWVTRCRLGRYTPSMPLYNNDQPTPSCPHHEVTSACR